MSKTVTIDGKEYELDGLSDQAKNDLLSLQLVDQKISQKQQDLAILQTARNAYARSLSEQLQTATQ